MIECYGDGDGGDGEREWESKENVTWKWIICVRKEGKLREKKSNVRNVMFFPPYCLHLFFRFSHKAKTRL